MENITVDTKLKLVSPSAPGDPTKLVVVKVNKRTIRVRVVGCASGGNEFTINKNDKNLKRR